MILILLLIINLFDLYIRVFIYRIDFFIVILNDIVGKEVIVFNVVILKMFLYDRNIFVNIVYDIVMYDIYGFYSV